LALPKFLLPPNFWVGYATAWNLAGIYMNSEPVSFDITTNKHSNCGDPHSDTWTTCLPSVIKL